MVCLFGAIRLHLSIKTEEKMKTYIYSKWITEDAIQNRQVVQSSFSDEMAVLKLCGRTVFQPGEREDFHHASLLLTQGELSFMVDGKRTVIPAPAYVEFIIFHQQTLLKTNERFEGYLLVVEHAFFQEIVRETRSVFSCCMYTFSQRPFVTLCNADLRRLLPFVEILMNTIGLIGHFFVHEVIKNTFRAFHIETWNVIFQRYKNFTTNEDMHHWNDVLSRFLYLMHTYYRERHEVRWYADQLCVSPNTLSIKLKRTYGKTATQLINECLADEAKNYLRNPAHTIQQVADMLSFSDQATFCKFFKRCCGVSPSDFRKGISAV